MKTGHVYIPQQKCEEKFFFKRAIFPEFFLLQVPHSISHSVKAKKKNNNRKHTYLQQFFQLFVHIKHTNGGICAYGRVMHIHISVLCRNLDFSLPFL